MDGSQIIGQNKKGKFFLIVETQNVVVVFIQFIKCKAGIYPTGNFVKPYEVMALDGKFQGQVCRVIRCFNFDRFVVINSPLGA